MSLKSNLFTSPLKSFFGNFCFRMLRVIHCRSDAENEGALTGAVFIKSERTAVVDANSPEVSF